MVASIEQPTREQPTSDRTIAIDNGKPFHLHCAVGLAQGRLRLEIQWAEAGLPPSRPALQPVRAHDEGALLAALTPLAAHALHQLLAAFQDSPARGAHAALALRQQYTALVDALVSGAAGAARCPDTHRP